jgi:hypothetical protein
MANKTIKINEHQLEIITDLIKEDLINNKLIIKRISNYLKKYYEPSFGTYTKNGEYHNEPMILNKIENNLIHPKNLLRHLTDKFNVESEFLSQVIRDWYDGKLEGDFLLSQNVSPSK